jgi:hypothetical protein
MTVRSMAAGAVCVLMLPACTPLLLKPAPFDGAGTPLRQTETRYVDDQERTLVVKYDADGTSHVSLEDPAKKSQLVPFKLGDYEVCKRADATQTPSEPRGESPRQCQPLTFVSEGALVKLGKKSCICRVMRDGEAKCYGECP